jgi:short-subunit dehydrogenase
MRHQDRNTTQVRVFLTGASSGIGAALARHYAAQGATLGLAARRGHRLLELAAGLPGNHSCYPLDVADAATVQAGVSAGTLGEEAGDLPAFRRIFETNVMGMAQTLQPFIAAMKARGSGRLVGIASVAGIRGLPGAGAYSASKAASIAWLEALRVELHGSGVRVVTIAPGYIATPMTVVNPYPMPFLMPAGEAAWRFARAIARGTSYTVIPWQMGVAAKLLRLLPNPVFDAIFARVGRKPRGLDL